MELLEERHLLAAITWTGGGADPNLWHQSANWDLARVPSAGDDVFIPDVESTSQITFNSASGSVEVNSLSSSEPLLISGGTLAVVDSAQLHAPFTLSGGTLTGAGTITVAASMVWSGGSMTGSGVTNAEGGLTIDGSGVKTIHERTLNNAGTAIWSGTGNLTGGVGSTINNLPTGLFDIQTDAAFASGVIGTKTFNNAGTLRKSVATGTTNVSAWEFNNSGSVVVQTGTLSINSGGSSTGAYSLSQDATLAISGSTYTLGAGASASGAGVLLVNGGTLTVADAAEVEVENFTLSSGTLTGAGTLDVTGLLRWTGGQMTGSGATGASGTLEISGTGAKTITARTLNNAGTATWTGTGNIIGGAGNTINNLAAGVFDIQTDAGFTSGFVGTKTFNNAGTLRKSVATGTTDIVNAWAINNSGTVEVQTGTLAFSSGFTQTSGMTLLNGGNINSSGTMAIQGGNLTGQGTITGNVNNSGGTVIPGTSPGQLTITGNYTQGLAGSLAIEIGGLAAGSEFDQLIVTGTASLAGTLAVVLMDDFVPRFGNSFMVVDGTTTGSFTTLDFPALSAGLAWELPGGSGTLTVGADATGVFWDGGGGDLSWHNPLNWSSDVLPGSANNVLIGATFAGVTITASNSATVRSVSSAAALHITGGTFTLGGGTTIIDTSLTASAGTLHLNGGSVMEGSGTLQIGDAGTLRLTGATVETPLNNAGLLQVVVGAGSTISGPLSTTSSSVIRLESVFQVGRSTLTVADGFSNAGLIELITPAAVDPATLTVTNGTLTNTGTIRASGSGTGFARVLDASLDNPGTLDVISSLIVGSAGRMFINPSGTVNITAATTLRINGGSLLGGTGFTGTGTLDLGGTHTAAIDAAGLTLAANGPLLTLSGNVTIAGPGTLINQKEVQLSGDTINAALDNQGMLRVAIGEGSTLNGLLNTTSSSVIRLESVFQVGRSTLTVADGFSNAGLIELITPAAVDPATLTVTNGTLTNTGTIRASGSGTGFARVLDASLDNPGTLDVLSSLIVGSAGRTFTNTSGTVSLAAATTLRINGGSLLGGTGFIGTGTLDLGGTHTAAIAAAGLTLAADGPLLTLSGNVTIAGPGMLTNQKEVQLSGDTILASLHNAGLLLVAVGAGSTINGALTTTSTSIIRLESVFQVGNSTLTVAGSFSNAGLIELISSAAVNPASLTVSSGTLTNTGTIRSSGSLSGFSNLNASLDNPGTLEVLTSVAIGSAGHTFTNSGLVDVQAGTLASSSTYTQTDGETRLSGGSISSSQPMSIQGGTVAGSGTVTANVSNSGGQLSPGLTGPGTLTIAGNYTQAAGGVLRIEIGGLNAGSQFDQLVVSGMAALAGTLAIELIIDFVPAVGNTFLIIQGTTTGVLTTLDLPALPAGRAWEVQSSSVTLAVLGVTPNGVWDGGGDGTSWHDAANWSNDILPGPEDDVVIDVPGLQTIVHSQGDTVIQSLTSHEAIVLQGGSLSLAGDSTLEADFTLTGTGELTGAGRLTLNDLFVWAGGTMAGSGVTVSTDRLRIDGSEPKYLIDTRKLNNQGDMLWTGGEVFRGLDSPAFNNFAGATFTIETDDDFLSGPTAGGQINNAGLIVKSSGVGTASLKSPVTNSGTLEIQSGVLRIIGGYTQGGDGKLLLVGGNIESNIDFNLLGGELRGYGRIVGHVQSSAAIHVGGQFGNIGKLEIVGDFEQKASGSLHLDLDSLGAGVSYDQLVVRGTATLAGTLAITPQADLSPPTGFAFEILDSGARSGVFQAITGTQLAAGKSLVPDYHADGLSLIVLAPAAGNAAGASQFLIDGLQQLGGKMADWIALFNLPEFDFSSLALPEFQLPMLPDELADLFDLELLAWDTLLPTIDVQQTFDALRQHLADKGFEVLCIADVLGTTVCDDDELVRIRFAHTFPELDKLVAFHNAVGGLLDGLSDSFNIDAILDVSAEARLVLEMGVDSAGFFLTDTSHVTLDIDSVTVNGGFGGSGNVGGVANVVADTGALSGAMAVSLTANQSGPKHRVDQLSDHRSLLIPTASGQAAIAIEATLGPLDLSWFGSFVVETAPNKVVTTTLGASTLTAVLTLPGLAAGTPSGDAEFSLASVYQPADISTNMEASWTMFGEGQAGVEYAWMDFQVEDLRFDVEITPSSFTGGGSGRLITSLPDDVPLELNLDVVFTPAQLDVTGSANFGATLLSNSLTWLESLEATFTLDAALGSGLPTATLGVEVPHAVLLPEPVPDGAAAGTVPEGVATATGLSGMLTSSGTLSLTADSIDVNIADTFFVTVEGAELFFGPGQTGPLFAAELVTGTVPALNNLELLFEHLAISRTGELSVSATAAADEFSFPGLTGSGAHLLSLTNFVFTLANIGDELSFGMMGDANFFGPSGLTFTTDGQLDVLETGLVGELALTMTSGFTLLPEGDFFIQVNTTDETHNGIDPGVHLHFTGEGDLSEHLRLLGEFALSTAVNNLLPLDINWVLFNLNVDGLAIPYGPQAADYLTDRIQRVYLGEPAAENRIPVQTEAHYDALLAHGGLLMHGSLNAPQLLTDPLALLAALPNLAPPENVQGYAPWIQRLVEHLKESQQAAQVQLFVPSLSSVVLGTKLPSREPSDPEADPPTEPDLTINARANPGSNPQGESALLDYFVADPIGPNEDPIDDHAPVNAYLLALLSTYVYTDVYTDGFDSLPEDDWATAFTNLVEYWGGTMVATHTNEDAEDEFGGNFATDTEFAVVEANGALIVTFRGTESPIDMLVDATFRVVPGVDVHEGFWTALQSVYLVLRDIVDDYDHSTPIWVTGHSLGGALATLAGLQLAGEGFNVRGVHTFGAPNVGGPTMALVHDEDLGLKSRLQRWVNDRDIIPMALNVVPSYREVGSANIFVRGENDDGSFTVQLNGVDPIAAPGMADHDIAFYMERIRSAFPEVQAIAHLLPMPPELRGQDLDLERFLRELGAWGNMIEPSPALADAYLEGTWDGKLLSVPISDGRIDANHERLLVHGQVPLLGLEASFDVRHRDVLVDGLTYPFPIASADVSIESQRVNQVLGNLGLPTNVLMAADQTDEFDASFRAYTPGFSGNPSEPELIKRVGGFELEARMSVGTLITDAAFRVAIPLSPESVLPGGVPDFVASASVSELSLPGLSASSDVLSLSDFLVEIRREQDELSMSLDGNLDLLGFRFATSGDLVIVDEGMYGSLVLTTGRGPLFGSELGFGLDGVFQLHVNTTGAAQDDIAPGARIQFDGLLRLMDNLQVFGSFDLALEDDLLLMTARDATFDMAAGQGSRRHTFLSCEVGQGAFQISPAGMAGSIDLVLSDAPNISGFDLSGGFLLQVNTTGEAVPTIGDVNVNLPAGDDPYVRVRVTGTDAVDDPVARLTVLGSTVVQGTFDLSVQLGALPALTMTVEDATFELAIGQGNERHTFASFEVNDTAMRVTPTGLAGSLELTLDDDGRDFPGADLSGTFQLQVNTTTAAVAAIGGVAVNLPEGPLVRVQVTGTNPIADPRARLTVLDSMLLEGTFNLTVQAGENPAVTVAVEGGRFDLAGWMQLDVSGPLRMDGEGIVGSLALTSLSAPDAPILLPFGNVELSGEFFARINTTTQTVDGIDPGAGLRIQDAVIRTPSISPIELTDAIIDARVVSPGGAITETTLVLDVISAETKLKTLGFDTPIMTFLASGRLQMTASHLVGELSLAIEQDATNSFGFTIHHGDFYLRANTRPQAVTLDRTVPGGGTESISIASGLAIRVENVEGSLGGFSLENGLLSMEHFVRSTPAAPVITRGFRVAVSGNVAFLGQTLVVQPNSLFEILPGGIFGNLELALSAGSSQLLLPSFSAFNLPAWEVDGTFGLTLSPDLNRFTLTGTLDVPGIGTDIGVSGSLGSDELGALSLNLDQFPVGGHNSPLILSGEFSLTRALEPVSGSSTSQPAVRFRVTDAALAWHGTSVLVGEFEIQGNGQFSATIPAQTINLAPLSALGMQLAIPAATFVANPAQNLFRANVGESTLAIPGFPTPFTIPAFQINTGANFSHTLASGSFNLGGFSVSGMLVFEQQAGQFQLGVNDPGRFTPAQFNVGAFFSADIEEFSISSNGEFNAVVSAGQLGPNALHIEGASLTFRKTGPSLADLHLELVGGKLDIPLVPLIDLPKLRLSSEGEFSRVITFASGVASLAGNIRLPRLIIGDLAGEHFELGYVDPRSGPLGPEVELKIQDGQLRLELLSPIATTILRSGSLQLTQFLVTSGGVFEGEITGAFKPPGMSQPLSSATFQLSRENNVVRLDVQNAFLDTSFFDASLSGFVKSNGDFNLLGAVPIDIGHATPTFPMHVRVTADGQAIVRRIGTHLTIEVAASSTKLHLPFNGEFTLPSLSFTLEGDVPSFSRSLSNALKLGQHFTRPPNSANLPFDIEIANGVVTLSRDNSFNIQVLPGSNLEFSDFRLDSTGDFAATVAGQLKVLGNTFTSGSFTATRDDGTRIIRLTLPQSRALTLPFMSVNVGGWVQSDNSFLFTGNKAVAFSAFGNEFQGTALDNGFSGNISVTLRKNAGFNGTFSGSFSGSATIAGENFGSASGTLSASGCLSISASKTVSYQYFDFRQGRQRTATQTISASQNFALGTNACGNSFAINASSVNGYIAGGLMFFDANGNGVLDFLDLNGNGVQDEDEPDEPSAITAADGSATLMVPEIFDRNSDGQFTADEGRLVVMGGIDLVTGLPLEVTLAAPIVNGGATVVSPLSTLAERLVSAHGFNAADALRLVGDRFDLGDMDLAGLDPIRTLVGGNNRAADAFAAQTQLHDTVRLVGRLISGAGGGLTREVADTAISLLAQHMSTTIELLDLGDIGLVAHLIADTAAARATTLSAELIAAATEVIVAGNRWIDQISREDADFMIKVKALQQTVLGVIADDLLEAGAVALAADQLVARNTGEALATRVAAARVGSMTPSRITIDDPEVIADASGAGQLVFTARLTHPSDLPISVLFATRDDTARAAQGDYEPQEGKLEFAPGETEATFTVDLRNLLSDSYKTVHVRLFQAENGVLEKWSGLGALRSSTAETIELDNAAVVENRAAADVGILQVLEPIGDEPYQFSVSDARFEVVQNRLKLRAGESLNWAVEPMVYLSVTARQPSVGGNRINQTYALLVERNDRLVLQRVAAHPWVAGAKIGTLSAVASQSPVAVISISDPRFEVDQGYLQLRADQQLDFESEPMLEITVLRSVGELVTRDVFVVDVLPAGAPRAEPDFYNVPTDGTLQVPHVSGGVIGNDTDAGDDVFPGTDQKLRVHLPSVVQPTLGTLEFHEDGTFLYTMNSGQAGDTDSFQYRAIDPTGLLGNATTVTLNLGRSAYQNPNPGLNFDVDADGSVTLLDALRIVNLLRTNRVSEILVSAMSAPPPDYYDVNGDGRIQLLDALLVVNEVTRSKRLQMLGAAAGELDSDPVIPTMAATRGFAPDPWSERSEKEDETAIDEAMRSWPRSGLWAFDSI